MSYFVEVIAESKTKRPACLDTIRKRLSNYSGLNWIYNPYKKDRLCVSFVSNSTFNCRILPAIDRIEKQVKVEVIVLDFRQVE